MQSKTAVQSRLALIAAMCIFGTIGLIRKYMDLPSGLIAFCRAWIGAGFLAVLLLIRGRKPDLSAIRKNALLLLLSGAALGFNWIALFEAYCHTTVAAATLCYYLAPTIVILVSPVLFRERLTISKIFCALIALIGITLVSGVWEAGFDSSQMQGILLGVAAAGLYAAVIVLNKKIAGVPVMDRTVCQLAVAGAALLAYTLLAEAPVLTMPSAGEFGLLAIAGILHTGIAYALYFGAIGKLPAHTAALYSYLDPILAIVLSALFLHEPLGLNGVIGAVLILGAAVFSERT